MTVSSTLPSLQNWRMTHVIVKRAFLLFALGFNPLCVVSVHASLGSDAASVAADKARLHGAVSSETRERYDIYEIATADGTRVREYLNRAGIVFGVAWTGPVLPDLQQLFGTHYPQYTTALAALDHPGLHRSLRIASGELVVEAGGHLRAYTGRAYLPALIPEGVSTGDLR